MPERPAECTDPPDGEHLLLAGAHEYLKTLAIGRLFLDNSQPAGQLGDAGPKIGQLALFFGANDMGSVMMEEKVVSAAGTATGGRNRSAGSSPTPAGSHGTELLLRLLE